MIRVLKIMSGCGEIKDLFVQNPLSLDDCLLLFSYFQFS
jgi:hypothetical protein